MNQAAPIISVCIPVKDFEVSPLVQALLLEIRSSKLPVEILVLEDGSSDERASRNASLAIEPEVSIIRFEKNRGRSAARNHLAIQAKGRYLLFIDADSLPVSPRYLSIYLEHAKTNCILCGGRHYSEFYKPAKSTLHWKYGAEREVGNSVNPEQEGFKSNNFFIEKSTFDNILFDESIVQYGHEDTLFGAHAKSKGISICSIENPVIHTDLQSNFEFMNKTEESIESLVSIVFNPSNHELNIDHDFKLWRVYKKIVHLKLRWVIKIASLFSALIRKTLILFSGPLVLFDLYKLILLDKKISTYPSPSQKA